MIDASFFTKLEPTQHCVAFTYAAMALASTCRIALENDTSSIRDIDKAAAVATTLEVMEALMSVVIDGAEQMEKTLKAGAKV